jgi:hypothetical protein
MGNALRRTSCTSKLASGGDKRDLIVAVSIVVDVTPNKALSLSVSLTHTHTHTHIKFAVWLR